MAKANRTVVIGFALGAYLIFVNAVHGQDRGFRMDAGALMFDESYKGIREEFVRDIGPWEDFVIISILKGKRDGFYTIFGVREVMSKVDPFSDGMPIVSGYEIVVKEPSTQLRIRVVNFADVTRIHQLAELVTRDPVPGFNLGDYMISKARPDIVVDIMCRRQVQRGRDNSLYGSRFADPKKATNCENLLALILSEIERARHEKVSEKPSPIPVEDSRTNHRQQPEGPSPAKNNPTRQTDSDGRVNPPTNKIETDCRR